MLCPQLVIMAGTVLLAYYFECTDTFGLHIQGFFCNDADLLKPYPGGEESSFIPPLILYCVVAAVPTGVVSNTTHLSLSLPLHLSLSLSPARTVKRQLISVTSSAQYPSVNYIRTSYCTSTIHFM